MRTQRSGPAHGRRLAPGFVAVATALTVAGCTVIGSDPADSGPPRLSPVPQPEVAAKMVEGRSAPEERLNACELLGLTTDEIIDLTGADMPDVEPTGSGDLGLLCTYGGPGSPERYEAGLESAAADSAATTTPEETPSDTTPAPALDPDLVPDTFAAGVVVPRGGAEAALAGQSTLLGDRYACSAIRGTGAGKTGRSAPGAPEAPAVVDPEPDALYIDCVAAPTGGGVEVHTILVSGKELWHITLLRPETPRSPEAEDSALAGLHRVADEILA
ncbi:hypothetical protein [Dietzia sp. ANT_WB102]|uniref:hypothetical protein n=1 Tax=Dietzia sp. ANT_WB102 TaxID=2597345 RepID=UPI0011EF9474|nr:hypothetical protein [Dietzia sp. ANT_WB102]KAA0918667.1 hypothetical protein FQ137_04885 [Dietzia sp. ANT_WB102]